MDALDNVYNFFANNGYEDLPETEKAEKELCEYLEGKGLEHADFEEYTANAMFSNMRQGFRYGFRFAIEFLFMDKEKYLGIMSGMDPEKPVRKKKSIRH